MNDRMSIVSFLAGGVTGAALALLLAPQSGDAARERIGQKVRDTADAARERIGRKVRDTADSARDLVRDTADSARDLTERVVERGEEIGDEAARRVHEVGSALSGHRAGTRGNGDEVAAT